MFIEDFNKNDYIVINPNNQRHIQAITKSFDEFIEDAANGIDPSKIGDMYGYIPDFSRDYYTAVAKQVPDMKWFVFDKSEIPSWFKADSALIIRSKNDKPSEKKLPPKKAPTNRPIQQGSNGVPKTVGDDQDMNVPNMSGDDFQMEGVKNIWESQQHDSIESGNKEAKIYVFGSSKGGTGKTFTALITARRYAQLHPGEKIAIADFDIIDPQVGISIRMIQPTLMSYWKNYSAGDSTFKTMHEFSTKVSNFPSNVDFYMAPKEFYIKDKNFWLSILNNLVKNYDTVFFDTGIDYINYPPISFVYKIADRVILTSTTSIKSVSSVLKQISRLKGTASSANANGVEVFKAEDGIGPKLRLAITGYNPTDTSNTTVIDTFSKNIKIAAIFGVYSSEISRAEYYGEWDIFDKNKKFNEYLDKLVDLNN